MTLPNLTVIEASAGTGKTFALVTRLLALIFGGVEPERIVALTFSRAAAGEIFNSFIERLSRAAASEKTANEESQRLGVALSRADFSAMLRKVISRQHLSLIGTLDSFLMRVVRLMPLELGLEGEVSVLSEYRTPVERLKLVGDMMRLEGDDSRVLFRDAFRLVNGTVGARGYAEGFAKFIEKWHSLYRDHQHAEEWGEAKTIWGDGAPDGLYVTIAEIRSEAENLERLRDKRGADTFVSAIADYSGGRLKDPPKSIESDPDVVRVVRMARMWCIARALEETRGVFRLMTAYERAYAAKVRTKGLISFDDMPRLLCELGRADRLALEYRMDARFDHWALDEFQDTSSSQWRAICNLVEESGQRDGEKSVFIVGDRKQSIYEWRGGDVTILGRQAEAAKLPGNSLRELNESYRYLGEISDAVNRVFGERFVQGALDMDDAPEGAKWRCREHKSHSKSARGFVEVIEATKAKSRAAIADFFGPIENSLKAVRPWERGISTAILVRTNDDGEAILAYLKSAGMERVVFEGDSNIADSPVLAAMAGLAKLAEHSADRFAYEHIVHSPLAAALWPDGIGDAATVSAELLAAFTRKGLVRVFRDAREALKAVPDHWNSFTESRFEDFIKCAAEFEDDRDSRTRLSDFVKYLENRTRRDYAEPGVVRIMTMHQSKGLGFDHVIIPFYERESLVGSSRHAEVLRGEKPSWMLSNPGRDAVMADETLESAERRREHIQRYASLCLDYVAMTRAKRALTIILHPRNKTAPAIPEKFSDLVRMSGLSTGGDASWYMSMAAKPDNSGEALSVADSGKARLPRREIAKVRPSESFHSGLSGDVLFADDFGAAAERGKAAHEEFERIEWLDADKATTALELELVKPTSDATVWRERAYELFVDGRWESGQFDRVVFWREGDGRERRAKVCDYKTNAVRKGESVVEFEARMRETYHAQMLAYRAALAALTGIKPENIELRLLLVTTQTVVVL